MTNCATKMFTHAGDSIAIDGWVKSCEDSPVTEVQMIVLSDDVSDFVSGVSMGTSGQETIWETDHPAVIARTTAVEVDPLCVTVVSGEQLCANVMAEAEGRKLTQNTLESMVNAAVDARRSEEGSELKINATRAWFENDGKAFEEIAIYREVIEKFNAEKRIKSNEAIW